MSVAREPGTYFELDDAWSDPGWTRVPNGIARCVTISRRVKGWILEVASHAPGRRLTFTDMIKFSKDGRDATYSTIKEAMDAGFVTRSQDRDINGRMGAVVYRLHVTPQNPSSEPLPGSPDAVGPETVKPGTSKKTGNSKDKDLKPSAPANADPGGQAPNTPKAGCGAPVTDLFGGQPPAPPAKRKRAAKTPDAEAEARDRNAGHAVKEWVDGYRTTGVIPPPSRCGQIGAEAKRLILAGNDPEMVIAAAAAAGRQGWWSIERQLTAAARLTSQSNVKRGRFGVSATELPADDWRRWVQE
jgi:hypothetical protein